MDIITYNWKSEISKKTKKKHAHTISDRNKLLNGGASKKDFPLNKSSNSSIKLRKI